jgi:ELWxxDGT repeat protein
LWKSNGTAAGTVLLNDRLFDPWQLKAVGSTLYFTNLNSRGMALWKSDGTVAGTVELQNFGEDGDDYDAHPGNLTNIGGRLFFSAGVPRYGNELYVVNESLPIAATALNLEGSKAAAIPQNGGQRFSNSPVQAGRSDKYRLQFEALSNLDSKPSPFPMQVGNSAQQALKVDAESVAMNRDRALLAWLSQREAKQVVDWQELDTSEKNGERRTVDLQFGTLETVFALFAND